MLRQFAPLLKNVANVGEDNCDFGMLRSERALVNLKSPLKAGKSPV
jgi:hypothetical protein